jgi:fibronectin-binding autotransporter adhesin
MSGSVRLNNTVDNSDYYIHSLIFTNDAGAFIIGGSNITIANVAGILQNSPNAQTISNSIFLGAAQTWTANSNLLTLLGPVSLGSSLLTVAGGSNTTLSGVISGSGGITKTGNGTLLLSGANTFTGVITNSAGTIESQNAQGISSANMVLNGGTLKISSVNQVYGQTFTIGAASTINVSANITNTLGNATDDLTGAGALTKTGSGVLVLGYGNNFSGGLNINAGTVIISNNASLGTGLFTLNGGDLYISGNTTISNAFNVAATSTLSADNGDDDTFVSSNITGSAGVTLNVRNLNGGTPPHSLIFTSNGFTFASDIDLDATSRLRFDNAAGTNTFSGNITGFGYNTETLLRNTAGGTTIISGANTFTGSVHVAAGTLIIQNSTALGNTTGTTTVDSGADLRLEGGIAVGAERLSIAGSGVGGNGVLRNVSGNNSWAGNITLTGASTIGSDAGGLAIGGIISGSTPITKVGSGALHLSGTNLFTGAFTNNAGSVIVATNNALGTVSGDTVIASGATLGFSNSVNYSTAEAVSVTGVGVGGNGVIQNLSGTNTFAGPVTMAGASTFKSSSGILNLTGAITNGGNLLTVNNASGATLGFSNIISGSGGLTVGGGGTTMLYANNTFTGDIIVTNAGTLSFQTSAAVMTNNVVLGGGTFSSRDGATNIFGNLTLTSNSTISLNSGGSRSVFVFTNSLFVDGRLVIDNWSGSVGTSGTDDRLYFTTDPGDFVKIVNFTGYGSGGIWLPATGELVPAPEPSAYVAGAFLLLLMGARYIKPKARPQEENKDPAPTFKPKP